MKHVVRKKENKNELTYWNFVAIDGTIRNQLDRCATPKGKKQLESAGLLSKLCMELGQVFIIMKVILLKMTEPT
jgi:hypothetical protein